MSAITIRNIPAGTHQALKDRAKRNSRSTEAEKQSQLTRLVVPTAGMYVLLWTCEASI